MVAIQGDTVVNNFLNTVPGAIQAKRDGVQYNLGAISLGTVDEVNSVMTLLEDSTVNSTFTKSRTVAAGLRVFKTSVSDTESGVMDVTYARDGS